MLSRRDLFAVFGAATFAAVGVESIPVSVSPAMYSGLLTVESHRILEHQRGMFIHVFLDGIEVTKRCYEADNLLGYVRLFCGDSLNHDNWRTAGRPHFNFDRDSVCKMRVYGQVEFKAERTVPHALRP